MNLDVFHPYIPYFGASGWYLQKKAAIKIWLGGCWRLSVQNGVLLQVIPKDGAQIQGQLGVFRCEFVIFECDIQVYNSKQDYLDDIFVNEGGTQDINRTRCGNEKGIIFKHLILILKIIVMNQIQQLFINERD